MKKIILFCLAISFSVNVISQTSMFNNVIPLYNGKSVELSPSDELSKCESTEKGIANKYYQLISANVIVKVMANPEELEELKSCIDENCLMAYNYVRNNPVFHISPIYYEKANSLLHKLIKIPKIRKFGLNLISDMLVDFCRYYPKDFTNQLLTDLKCMQSFLYKMDQHKYEAILGIAPGEYALYVDGKEDIELSLGLEGFIIRRIIIDGISKDEISLSLSQLIQRIQSLDISSNSDILSKISLNGINYCVTAVGNYYCTTGYDNKIFPYEQNLKPFRGCQYEFMYGESTISRLEDNTGEYYLIERSGNCWEVNGGEVVDKSSNKKILIDKQGNIIYNE